MLENAGKFFAHFIVVELQFISLLSETIPGAVANLLKVLKSIYCFHIRDLVRR